MAFMWSLGNHVIWFTFNMIGTAQCWAQGLEKSLKLSLKQSLAGFFPNCIEKNRRIILNTHTHRENMWIQISQMCTTWKCQSKAQPWVHLPEHIKANDSNRHYRQFGLLSSTLRWGWNGFEAKVPFLGSSKSGACFCQLGSTTKRVAFLPPLTWWSLPREGANLTTWDDHMGGTSGTSDRKAVLTLVNRAQSRQPAAQILPGAYPYLEPVRFTGKLAGACS